MKMYKIVIPLNEYSVAQFQFAFIFYNDYIIAALKDDFKAASPYILAATHYIVLSPIISLYQTDFTPPL